MHPTAKQGFVTPDVYERGRPGYAQGAVDALGLGPRDTVVDLGCGTGKFTRQLISTGASVVGIEPLPTMLAGLRSALPGARAAAGLAEDLPLRDGVVDTLVCASTFHWFDHERALPEIWRVLRPGGRLAIVWNRRDRIDGWPAEFFAISERHRGNTPGYRSGAWEDALGASALFGPIEEAFFDHVQVTDPDGLVARVESISFIETLAPEEKRAVLDECRRFIATHPQTRGKTEIEMPYRTSLYTTARLPEP